MNYAGTEPITAHEDTINTDEITARIEDIRERFEDDMRAGMDEDERAEYDALLVLDDEMSQHGDYPYSAITLIHDDYFKQYARETAEDLGLISEDTAWPATHIDWEAAADSLKMDYSEVEYRGSTYYYR